MSLLCGTVMKVLLLAPLALLVPACTSPPETAADTGGALAHEMRDPPLTPSTSAPAAPVTSTAGSAEAELEVPNEPAGKSRYAGQDLMEHGGEGDRLLAVVAGQEIRASDLYRNLFFENPIWVRQALQNEILFILTREEALRLGITVDRAATLEVERQMIDDHRARCAALLDASLTLERFIEEQYGMPFAAYTELVRRTALFNLLLDRCVRYLEIGKRRLELGVIVVSDPELGEEVRGKLLQGASFDVLAKQHSLDQSAARGGILAPIPVDPRHPLYPLVAGALDLEEGAVSKVQRIDLPSQKMFRIIKVVQDLPPQRGAYHELCEAVEAGLSRDPVDLAAIHYWQECVRGRYGIDIKEP